MLELQDVSAGYGHGPVVQGVSLHVDKGETVAVLGPNGAGKSTLMNALSGTVPQRGGVIRLGGQDIAQLPSHGIVARGLVQVPEGRRIFSPLSVEDNLRLGSVALKQRSDGELTAQFDFVYQLFPRLAERRRQLAGTLSGGEQQMVAVGRALMSRPKVLLLDEPFLGLAPLVVEEIRMALERLRTEGLTMLLVEQKLDIALPFTNRAYVMIKGQIVLTDDSAALAQRDDLSQLYFKLAQQSSDST